jgi:hypothetical protein
MGKSLNNGYLNQANCRANHADAVALLYATVPDQRVISL